MSLRKQPLDHLDSNRSGKNSVARLEFPNFQLNLIFLRFADIRRVGDHEVQVVEVESLEQIPLTKVNSLLQLKAGGVDARDFERGSRYIRGVDFGVRKFLG